MPESAIGTDFDEALDVHRNILAQIAFHRALRLDHLADAVDLVFTQVGNFFHRIHVGRVQNARRARIADTVDVSERDIRVFVARKIDACDTSHDPSLVLALSCQLSALSNCKTFSLGAACVSNSRRSPASCHWWPIKSLARHRCRSRGKCPELAALNGTKGNSCPQRRPARRAQSGTRCDSFGDS